MRYAKVYNSVDSEFHHSELAAIRKELESKSSVEAEQFLQGHHRHVGYKTVYGRSHNSFFFRL